MSDQLNRVLLSDEQNKVLHLLLQKRSRLFILGLLGVLFIWFRISLPIFVSWYGLHFFYPEFYFDKDAVEKINWGFISSLIMLAGFFLFFGRILFRRIIPVYKDYKHKSGVYVPMEIMRKSIPYHNRCFFFFDDLKIPYKETDPATYYHYQPGDKINVLMGEHSRTHIDEYLNIPVL